MTEISALAEHVRSHLELAKKSQARLARDMGISAKHLSNVLRGLAPLTEDVARRLNRATRIPLRELLPLVNSTREAPWHEAKRRQT